MGPHFWRSLDATPIKPRFQSFMTLRFCFVRPIKLRLDPATTNTLASEVFREDMADTKLDEMSEIELFGGSTPWAVTFPLEKHVKIRQESKDGDKLTLVLKKNKQKKSRKAQENHS